MINKQDVIHHPKNILARLICDHDPQYYRKIDKFYNLSGDTYYRICNKCGKRMGEIFVTK